MIGGTCIDLACIPSKTVIRSAEVAELARDAGAFGIDATRGLLDPASILARKQAVVGEMRATNLRRLEASGAEPVFGEARFIAPRRVQVGDSRVLEGEHMVVNLGTRPASATSPAVRSSRTSRWTTTGSCEPTSRAANDPAPGG